MVSAHDFYARIGRDIFNRYWVSEKISEYKTLLENEKIRVAKLAILPVEKEKVLEFQVRGLELQIQSVEEQFSEERYKKELADLRNAMTASYVDWLKSKTELFQNALGESHVYHKNNYAALTKEMEEKSGIDRVHEEYKSFSVKNASLDELKEEHKKTNNEYCERMDARNGENAKLMTIEERIGDLVRLKKYCEQDTLDEKESVEMQKRLRYCFAFQLELDAGSTSRLDGHRFNLFHYACMVGDKSTVTELFPRSLVYSLTGEGFSSMHVVARYNHLYGVELLDFLSRDREVGAIKTDQHETLLHSAVKGMNLAAMKWLVEVKNVDVNAEESHSKRHTPLRSALFHGCVEAARYLLGRKAKPIFLTHKEKCLMLNAASKAGMYWIVDSYYACLEVATPRVQCPKVNVKALEQKPDKINKNGLVVKTIQDPIFIERLQSSIKKLSSAFQEEQDLLIKYFVPYSNNCIREMIKFKEDLFFYNQRRWKDHYGIEPLFDIWKDFRQALATRWYDFELEKLKEKYINYYISWARKNGLLDGNMSEKRLRHLYVKRSGIEDILSKYSKYWSPPDWYEHTLEEYKSPMRRRLRGLETDLVVMTQLKQKCQQGKYDEKLMHHILGQEVFFHSSCLRTYVFDENYQGIFRYICMFGNKHHANGFFINHSQPLDLMQEGFYLAAQYGNLCIVKCLLEERKITDINAPISQNASTPLYAAAYEGHAVVVEYLLSKGAEDDQLDDSRFSSLAEFDFSQSRLLTHLMAAIIRGHIEVARVFYRYGIWLSGEEQKYLLDKSRREPTAADAIYSCLQIPILELTHLLKKLKYFTSTASHISRPDKIGLFSLERKQIPLQWPVIQMKSKIR